MTVNHCRLLKINFNILSKRGVPLLPWIPPGSATVLHALFSYTPLAQRRLDMRHHSCDIPKVFSHVPIDTEQL